MLGFIIKDFTILKSNLKFIMVQGILYLILSFNNSMNLSFLLSFMSIVLMFTTFSYDNYNKWDGYAATLPNGRKNSVRAKFVTTLILMIILVFIVLGLTIIINLVKNTPLNYKELFLTLGINFFVNSFILSLMYPIIYKFGIEKARICIFALVFGIIIILGLLIKLLNLDLSKLDKFLNNYSLIIIMIILLGLIYLAYKISLHISLKKEY